MNFLKIRPILSSIFEDWELAEGWLNNYFEAGNYESNIIGSSTSSIRQDSDFKRNRDNSNLMLKGISSILSISSRKEVALSNFVLLVLGKGTLGFLNNLSGSSSGEGEFGSGFDLVYLFGARILTGSKIM